MKTIKKKWQSPDVIIISQAINSGSKITVNEAAFTPNHTHYITSHGGIANASLNAFSSWVS